MTILKLISFDLQGTLSDCAFSDEFWLDVLPALYAKTQQISHEEAKNLLEQEFKSIGKYHELFYNHRLRLNALLPNGDFQAIARKLKTKPRLDPDILNAIKEIPSHIPKIILSATTRDFIDLELSGSTHYFQHTFSSIDDFNIPGKPPELYRLIATRLGVRAENCLHIGDCREMDYENAKLAGWSGYHWNRLHPREECLLGLKLTLENFLRKVQGDS